MHAGEDFAALLLAAQRGEEWAFAALYRGLNARILRYFASRAPGSAEDLAADTWMGAARNLRSFEGDERSFRAWLFTIANRRLVQHWRELGRRPTAEPSSSVDPGSTPAGEVEDTALQSVMAHKAAATIAGLLTSDQAEVILLRVLGGLDIEEITKILGKRSGAVRALQHKGIRRLAESKFLLDAVTP